MFLFFKKYDCLDDNKKYSYFKGGVVIFKFLIKDKICQLTVLIEIS